MYLPYISDYLLTVMAPKEHSILTKSSQAATQSTISPTDGIAHQPSTMSYDDILGYFRGKYDFRLKHLVFGEGVTIQLY